MTLYKVLNLSRGASLEQVKSAFRKLAFQLHPDVHGGDKIKSEKYLEVSNAYAILGNPEEKRKYDSTLIPEPSASNNSKYDTHKSQARNVHDTTSKHRQRDTSHVNRGFDVNRWYSEQRPPRPTRGPPEPDIDLESKLTGFSESEKAEIIEKMQAKLRRAYYN